MFGKHKQVVSQLELAEYCNKGDIPRSSKLRYKTSNVYTSKEVSKIADKSFKHGMDTIRSYYGSIIQSLEEDKLLLKHEIADLRLYLCSIVLFILASIVLVSCVIVVTQL